MLSGTAKDIVLGLKILARYTGSLDVWAEHDEFGIYSLNTTPSEQDQDLLDELGWFPDPDDCEKEEKKAWKLFV